MPSWLPNREIPWAIADDPAGGEQHDRDDERPEIDFAGIAERMLRVGRPAGPLHPDQQQTLIAGVDQAVDRLGEHRRRPGEQPGGKLRRGDAEIGGERREDDLVRSPTHVGMILSRVQRRACREGCHA